MMSFTPINRLSLPQEPAPERGERTGEHAKRRRFTLRRNNTTRMSAAMVVLVGWMAAVPAAFAQPLPESLWQQALKHNPRLESTRLAVEAAERSESAVGLWPNLELQAGVFTRPMEFMMGDQRLELQAMQMLPQSAMFRAQRRELGAMSEAQRALADETERMIRRELTQMWVERVALGQELRLMDEAIGLIAQMQSLAEAQVVAGGRQSDLIRLQLRKTEMEAERERLRQSLPGVEEAIWALVGDSAKPALPLPAALARPRLADAVQTETGRFTDHPAVRMASADALAAQARSDMASAEQRPMLGVGIQYMPIRPRTDAMGMSTSGDDMLMPMVSLSIPVSRGRQRAKADAARIESRAIQAESRSRTSELYSQWMQTLAQFRQAETMADLTAEQERLSKSLYELSMSEYQTGQMPMEALLEIQETWIEYQKNRLSALVELHRTLAKLEELQPNLAKTYENE